MAARDATTVDGSSRPSRVHYQVLAVGCTFTFLTYLQRQAFVGGMPEIQNALALSTQQMGYISSAFLVAYGLFQVPCGLVGDRLGARNLLTMLVLGWSAVTALTAFAGTIPTNLVEPFTFLMVARFLFGVFQSGAFPVWTRAMTDWTPLSERATGQGTAWMFSRLGGAVGPLVFLAMFQLFDTWTTPLWLLAALGLVWCAAFWPWFRDSPEQMPRVNAAERQQIAADRGAIALQSGPLPWSMLLSSKNVWALCWMYGFVGFAGNFITSMLPVYLAGERHLPPELVKGLAGLPLAFGIVSCLLGGLLSDWITRLWGNRKWGRRLNGAVGLALAGLCFLAVPWVQSTWLLGLAFSGAFFMSDLNMGPAWAACADVGERYAGTVSGAMNMFGQMCGAVGTSLAGYMLHQGQSTLLFAVFACSYGLAALCWFVIDVTRPIGRGAV